MKWNWNEWINQIKYKNTVLEIIRNVNNIKLKFALAAHWIFFYIGFLCFWVCFKFKKSTPYSYTSSVCIRSVSKIMTMINYKIAPKLFEFWGILKICARYNFPTFLKQDCTIGCSNDVMPGLKTILMWTHYLENQSFTTLFRPLATTTTNYTYSTTYKIVEEHLHSILN